VRYSGRLSDFGSQEVRVIVAPGECFCFYSVQISTRVEVKLDAIQTAKPRHAVIKVM
jgi:hypothetical protein